MLKTYLKLFLSILLISNLALAQTTRYVRCSTGSDSNDGSSWANSFLTIQHCIDSSASDDKCVLSDYEICTLSASLDPTTLTGGGSLGNSFTIEGGDDTQGDSIIVKTPSNMTGEKGGHLSGGGAVASVFANLTLRGVGLKNLKITNFIQSGTSVTVNPPRWGFADSLEITNNSAGGFILDAQTESTYINIYGHGNSGNYSNLYRFANTNVLVEGNILYETDTTSPNSAVFKTGGSNSTFLNNYFYTANPNATYAVELGGNYRGGYYTGNTFIRESGLVAKHVGEGLFAYNNVFESITSTTNCFDLNNTDVVKLGHNAFKGCTNHYTNVGYIINDLRSGDVTFSVSAYNEDFSLETDSDLVGAGYGIGASSIDIGAVQAVASGGSGGGIIFIPIIK